MDKKLKRLLKNIPGWLTEDEAYFLADKSIKTQFLKGVIVEIGSFHGRSTICLAQGQGKVYAVDPHRGYIDKNIRHKPTLSEFKKVLKTAKVANRVLPVVKTSKEAARDWKKDIRLLFIDALHDEKNAAMDFKLWSKYLIKDGIVVMHDSFMHWCGSEKVALKEIVNSSKFYKIGVVRSIIYGVKGKGTFVDKLIKLCWQIYINTMVHLNHFRIIIVNFPSLIRTRLKATIQ